MSTKLDIVYVEIQKIKQYKNNAKKHDKKQIDNVAESIRQFGFVQPIVLDKDNVIIIGHCRLLAAKSLKLKTVPVHYAKYLTDEQVKKLRILDNKLNESEWDDDLLRLELEDLDFVDFEIDFGLDFEEEKKEIVEDEVPEVDEKADPICKLGDIYQLGNHRLMCGDSTKEEDVAKLMNGNKADMVFTDPPYGVSYEGGLNEKKKAEIKNDALKGNTLYTFLYDVFRNLKASTKDKSAIYIFYATKTTREFINAFDDAGLKQRGIIAWYKKGGGFGDFMAHYMNAYEPCIYGSNGESVNWYGASNEKTIWEINKEKKCDLHPTMKPIEVVARAIRNSSVKGNSVLDLFGGSGSTLIACEQLDRTCYMMELDPKYCDVIIKRWENLTGKKAVKL